MRDGRKLHRGFFLLKRLLHKFLIDNVEHEQQNQRDLSLLGKVFTPGTILICLIFTFTYTLLCLQLHQYSIISVPQEDSSTEKTMDVEMISLEDFHYPVVGNLLGYQLAQFSSSQPPRRSIFHSGDGDELQIVPAKNDHDEQTGGVTEADFQSFEAAGGLVLPYLEPESDLLEKLKRAPTAHRKKQEQPTETEKRSRPEI